VLSGKLAWPKKTRPPMCNLQNWKRVNPNPNPSLEREGVYCRIGVYKGVVPRSLEKGKNGRRKRDH